MHACRSTLEDPTEVSLGFQPFTDRWIDIGPRLAYLLSLEKPYPSFFAFGAEGVVWVMNAVGPGLAADVALEEPFRWRVEPFVTFRLIHFTAVGAWAVRVGGIWDSETSWALKAGITLQFRGVDP